ncbi:STAS domain-containing protein [Streptomyces sp. NPDC102394]|uniref:STAS domain-containing protein n=1 Tax=Streptomyces sp. NPDC102394 TaxID=3366167 RepID=UPI0037FD3CDD
MELQLVGELDADTAPGLREDLAAVAAGSAGGLLVLCLSGITYCDTAGLYTLVAIRHTLPLADIDVQFVGVSPGLYAIAARSGLTSHLAWGDDC